MGDWRCQERKRNGDGWFPRRHRPAAIKAAETGTGANVAPAPLGVLKRAGRIARNQGAEFIRRGRSTVAPRRASI